MMKKYLTPELLKRINFTLLLLIVCRIGAYIPVPGINGDMAVEIFKRATGGTQNLFQLMDVFSGGAFAQMTLFALGVMPYISASIVMQLLVALIPSLQLEVKENPEAGRRKVGRWTRYLTLGLAFFQSTLFAKYALGLNRTYPGIIVPEILNLTIFNSPWLFFLIVIFSMTAGTLLLMWIGEQITEKGVGNGVSLVISVGILSSLPSMVRTITRQLNLESQEPGSLGLVSLIFLAFMFVTIVGGTILIVQAQRKIFLQYARRIVGRREVQGGSAYIPLKVNFAGVVPVIFASSLLMFPGTIGQFLRTDDNWFGKLATALSPGSVMYTILYVLLILFFTYFWTSTQFHPEQVASDMKKNGAFIPGIRQGRPTQDYLQNTMSKITFLGSFSLAFIAILPTLVSKFLGIDTSVSYFFGGTSLLILVGVVLDTAKQIDSHLLSKRYDGLLRKSVKY